MGKLATGLFEASISSRTSRHGDHCQPKSVILGDWKLLKAGQDCPYRSRSEKEIFEHVEHCYSGSIDLIDMHRRSNIRRRVAFTHIADQLRCQDIAKHGFISQQE